MLSLSAPNANKGRASGMLQAGYSAKSSGLAWKTACFQGWSMKRRKGYRMGRKSLDVDKLNLLGGCPRVRNGHRVWSECCPQCHKLLLPCSSQPSAVGKLRSKVLTNLQGGGGGPESAELATHPESYHTSTHTWVMVLYTSLCDIVPMGTAW